MADARWEGIIDPEAGVLEGQPIHRDVRPLGVCKSGHLEKNELVSRMQRIKGRIGGHHILPATLPEAEGVI
jgi:hypothetical protein